jgi:hypothetical protein
MTGQPRGDDFVARVMEQVARQERRLPLVAAALVISALVLAVPAVAVLVARPAFDAAFSLALAGCAEAVTAAAGSPVFWLAVAVTAGWLIWLATRALRGAR